MNILADLFLTFFKVGAFTFGGGYAMIDLLDHECVEKKNWLTREELMDVTVIAESTPGPIAINCATYTGWKKAGMAGALGATFGIVLPSFVIIFLISQRFENILSVPMAANAFRGARIAAAFLIVRAAVKMLRGAAKKPAGRRTRLSFAAISFAAVATADILGFRIPTALVIIAGGIAGYCAFSLVPARRAGAGK